MTWWLAIKIAFVVGNVVATIYTILERREIKGVRWEK